MCVFMSLNVFKFTFHSSKQIRYLFLQHLYLAVLISRVTFSQTSRRIIQFVTRHQKSITLILYDIIKRKSRLFRSLFITKSQLSSKVQELATHSTRVSPEAAAGRGENKAIVNHCCVFGRLLLGVILLHYCLLSILYSTLNTNTAFIKILTKVYGAVNIFIPIVTLV